VLLGYHVEQDLYVVDLVDNFIFVYVEKKISLINRSILLYLSEEGRGKIQILEHLEEVELDENRL
jgi:hypothetical protein